MCHQRFAWLVLQFNVQINQCLKWFLNWTQWCLFDFRRAWDIQNKPSLNFQFFLSSRNQAKENKIIQLYRSSSFPCFIQYVSRNSSASLCLNVLVFRLSLHWKQPFFSNLCFGKCSRSSCFFFLFFCFFQILFFLFTQTKRYFRSVRVCVFFGVRNIVKVFCNTTTVWHVNSRESTGFTVKIAWRSHLKRKYKFLKDTRNCIPYMYTHTHT